MSTDTDRQTALGRLITEVQTTNRWSYADISANASAGGRRLSKSRVESLRNDALPSISIKAIEALAAGLKVAPQRVAQAAIESMGYAVESESVSASELLAGDPTLSDPMRRVLMAALEAARLESETNAPPRRGRRSVAPPDDNALQLSAADDA